MSAFLVIWPPQVSDTAESLMACLLGWPSEPFGWNASNSPLRSFSVSSLVSVSERICTVAEPPLPTIDHRFGGLAQCLAEHVLDLLGADRARRTGGRHRHLGAALEVDAEGEAAEHDARDRDRDDQAADREPQLASPDDLERAGAGVEPDEEAVPAALPALGGFEVGRLDGAWSRSRRMNALAAICAIPVPSRVRPLVVRVRSAAPPRAR